VGRGLAPGVADLALVVAGAEDGDELPVVAVLEPVVRHLGGRGSHPWVWGEVVQDEVLTLCEESGCV